MKQALLDRTETCVEGTFGWVRVVNELTGEQIFSCASLERPSTADVSVFPCIPSGSYEFYWRESSPKHPAGVYEAREVPGRTAIQIHSANLAGDEIHGYVSQLDGCIALGRQVVEFNANQKPAGARAQRGVSSSRQTIADFVNVMGHEPFVLTIKEAWTP